MLCDRCDGETHGLAGGGAACAWCDFCMLCREPCTFDIETKCMEYDDGCRGPVHRHCSSYCERCDRTRPRSRVRWMSRPLAGGILSACNECWTDEDPVAEGGEPDDIAYYDSDDETVTDNKFRGDCRVCGKFEPCVNPNFGPICWECNEAAVDDARGDWLEKREQALHQVTATFWLVVRCKCWVQRVLAAAYRPGGRLARWNEEAAMRVMDGA